MQSLQYRILWTHATGTISLETPKQDRIDQGSHDWYRKYENPGESITLIHLYQKIMLIR